MSEVVEFVGEVCRIYFRSVVLEKVGDRVGQHEHDHDHAMYCGSGLALYVIDGEKKAEVKAGDIIEVLAGHKHEFIALEDCTRLTCVHDAKGAESFERVVK